MTKAERAEIFRSFLAEEGYLPKLDEDGDVRFKYEGGLYFIGLDEDDEEYVRLVYPNLWSIESDDERERVTKAALSATAATKVAKVYPVRDNTWAAVELFCSPPEVFKAVFRRSLSAIQASVDNFGKTMRGE